MPVSDKDKRHFKRYRKQTGFRLKIAGKSFKAETIDYSFDGIGAFVEDSPPITQGSIVDVDMSVPDLHAKGRVVWARKSSSGLMLGILRVDVPKKGRLEDFPLADLLIGLQRSGSTGVLRVDRDAGSKKIYISNGDIIFSTSEHRDDRLGEFLFRARTITLEQYKLYADVIKRSAKRDGAVLVDLGYIKPNELPEIVRRSAEDIILSLFSLESGRFEFDEGPLPHGEAITLKLSAANIIYRGIKRIGDPQKIFNFLQLPMDTVLSFSEDPLDLFQDIALDADDKRILSFINGKETIRDITSSAGADSAGTLRSIYALLSTRMIEVKEDGAAGGISAEEVIKDSEIKLDEGFVNRVDGIYRDYEKLGYYGVLDIKQWATSDDIKRAYYRAAKEFHPDRHFHLKSEAIKEKLNTIFSYITAAYSTLYEPGKRREYDMLLKNRSKGITNNQATARVKFEEGVKAFKGANYTEAFQLFGQAVYMDKNVADYHFYYGLALTRLERFKEAGRALERAIERAPSNPEYLTELGNVFLRLGFHHRAKSTFEKVINIDPNNRRALEGLSKIQG